MFLPQDWTRDTLCKQSSNCSEAFEPFQYFLPWRFAWEGENKQTNKQKPEQKKKDTRGSEKLNL